MSFNYSKTLANLQNTPFDENTLSDIESDYVNAYNRKVYSFIGDTLYHHPIGNIAKISPYKSNSESAEATGISKQLNELPGLSTLYCLGNTYNNCLAFHNGDGLEARASIITKNENNWKTISLPFPVAPYYPHISYHNQNSWLLMSYSKGALYQVNTNGTFEKLDGLDVDSTIIHREVIDGSRINGVSTITLSVDKKTLLTDRKEIAWTIINSDLSYNSYSPPSNCLFVTYIGQQFVCRQNNASNATELQFYKADAQTGKLTFQKSINIGISQLQYPVWNTKNGFWLQVINDGYQKLKYISLDIKEQEYAKQLNDLLETYRGTGNLSITGINTSNTQLLLAKTSQIFPVEDTILNLPDHTKPLGALDLKVTSQGQQFFDPSNIHVERRYHASRKVPYTVIRKDQATGVASGKAIISVYGSYGIPLQEEYLKEFSKYWVEQGGLFVYAHVRGGGGFGNTWRYSGYGINKYEAILDLEAVAEEVVDLEYARAGEINLISNSAGGIVAGAAVIRRYDLFDQIALTSPCLILWDNARSICTETDEFGDPTNPQQMKIMQSYSPGHLLVSSQVIPRFMIIQSANDQIVPPVVAKSFIDIRPDINFVKYLEINSTVHGEQYPAPIRAKVAYERLKFLLKLDDVKP